MRLLERVVERSPYLPIRTDWETYRESLERGFRKELSRRRRRLGELGCLAFELHDGSERLEELLEEGFRVEASGWKGENGTAIVSRPETRRFYTEIARWAAGRGWLRLGGLRLDGELIAFELNLEAQDAWFVLKGGYDERYRKYGPGTLIVEDIVRVAFERGLSSYEFLGSDDAYKLDWTSELRDRVLLQAFRRSPRGLAEHAAFAYGRPAVKRLLALRRR
jgi:CelD/BcsL family acetyltransferase involved in cellulose biosynthesis